MESGSVRIKLFGVAAICVLFCSTMNAQPDIKQAIKAAKKCVVQVVCPDIDSKGTGFIVHKDGYVLTCNHVVCQYVFENNVLKQAVYSTKITIRFEDGTELPAKIAFQQNLVQDNRPLLYDYAILKVEGKGLTPTEFESYDSLEEGSDVYFCGYPLSSQHLTTHKGMISAKYTREGTFNHTPQKVFQIEGAINKGNSGGPLFDFATRKVVGIISTREGGISKDLGDLRDYIVQQQKQGSGGVFIQGVNPLPVIVELTNTLDRYISVGIGHGVSVEYALLHLKELAK